MNPLAKIPKDELIKRFGTLVQSERKLTAEIVEYIKEIDFRKIYLDLGYTSLFAYLTEGIGYTAASAQRRIDSARLLRDLPEIKNEIQSGKLNLMQLAVVAQSVRAKEKQDPVTVTNEDKREILRQVANQNLFETQATVSQLLDIQVVDTEKARAQRDGSVRLEMTITSNETQTLERVKELLSSTHPYLSNKDLLLVLCREFLKRKDPLVVEERLRTKERGRSGSAKTSACPVVQTGATVSSASPVSSSSSIIPVSRSTRASNVQATSKMEVKRVSHKVRRFILDRDRCCQWTDNSTGLRCKSRFDLEVDHRQPRWAGGDNSTNNLQVLCGVHNRLKYRQNAGLC